MEPDKIRLKNKGFSLLEAIAATLILVIIGTGIAAVYVVETALLSQAAHRLEAINYARTCAGHLTELGGSWSEKFIGTISGSFGAGLHTVANTPDICTLPETYFRDTLSGTLTYEIQRIPVLYDDQVAVQDRVFHSSVDEAPAGTTTYVLAYILRAKITVTWEEHFPTDTEKTETFYAAVANYFEVH